jgi:hypothetical protein
MDIITYVHHGRLVKVREELRGRHREFCLCHICDILDTENQENNCSIANRLFSLRKETGVVTPVWECVYFEEKEC